MKRHRATLKSLCSAACVLSITSEDAKACRARLRKGQCPHLYIRDVLFLVFCCSAVMFISCRSLDFVSRLVKHLRLWSFSFILLIFCCIQFKCYLEYYHKRAHSTRSNCCRLACTLCRIIILALSAPYLVPTCFKILHLTATVAHISADYCHECRRMMCLLQMPFENIGSVSTVESNYFFAKLN